MKFVIKCGKAKSGEIFKVDELTYDCIDIMMLEASYAFHKRGEPICSFELSENVFEVVDKFLVTTIGSNEGELLNGLEFTKNADLGDNQIKVV